MQNNYNRLLRKYNSKIAYQIKWWNKTRLLTFSFSFQEYYYSFVATTSLNNRVQAFRMFLHGTVYTKRFANNTLIFFIRFLKTFRPDNIWKQWTTVVKTYAHLTLYKLQPSNMILRRLINVDVCRKIWYLIGYTDPCILVSYNIHADW